MPLCSIFTVLEFRHPKIAFPRFVFAKSGFLKETSDIIFNHSKKKGKKVLQNRSDLVNTALRII
jgi:hypothetical protein